MAVTLGSPVFIAQYLESYDPHQHTSGSVRLWLEKQRTCKPMTRLVAEALDEYFAEQQN